MNKHETQQALNALRPLAQDLDRQIAELNREAVSLQKRLADAQKRRAAIRVLEELDDQDNATANDTPPPLELQPSQKTTLAGLSFRQALLAVIGNAPMPLHSSMDIEKLLLHAGYEDRSQSSMLLKHRIAAEVAKLQQQGKVRRGAEGLVVCN